MKKITTFLFVLMALTSTLFAQTKPTYCDSAKAEISFTITGTKVTFTLHTKESLLGQNWTFGDGSASYDLSPTHDYGKAGTFEPCVNIKFKNPRDPNSYCIKKVCTKVTTTSSDPCANFNPTFSYSINGTEVIFEASGSSTTGYTYKWDLGDNSTSTDRVVKHTYKAGSYKPCVTIYDPTTRCSKTICKEITIQGSDPCTNFNPTADITVDEHGLATYKASWSTTSTYSWSFGDGTSSSTNDGTHQYKPGSYKVCVTITGYVNDTKCTKTLCKEITVKGNEDPCRDFNPKFEYKIGENGVVTFYGGNTTNTLTFTWSFGDGTAGSGQQTTHTYKPGTYKPCVTIYDKTTGCKKTTCWEIEIKGNNSDPCKDFNPTFNYKIDGNVVVFEGPSQYYTYKWSFGDGKYSTDRVVKFDFKKPGTYKVCVMITDPKTKCSKTVCKEIVIKGKDTQDPCKNFNPKVSFQTDGLKVILSVDGGKGATMMWNFGDGTKGSTNRTVAHVYAKSGKYTICVTVYDAKRKCKKTICFTIGVEGKTTQDPCANFKPDFSYKVNGNTVTVEGTHLYGVEYSWSWGDKLGDKGRTGSHTYKYSGKYNLCMTAYDPKTKCTKTICKTIIVVGNHKLMDDNNGDKETISVYPNPATSVISVVTLSESAAKIYVKDIYGTEVIRYDAIPNENKSIDMLINDLPKGTYYIIVEQDGKVETTKFLK